jgi:predicted RNA-binding Zn-ribbon protein involved in translation (DUF1610 family)
MEKKHARKKQIATITDFVCYANGKHIACDAVGNNVAFACPNCEYPILGIAGPVGTRGFKNIRQEFQSAKCRNCQNEYRLLADEAKREISITVANSR